MNRLGAEKSPYLLQHKDNPVHWYPWGEEAFRAAREANKPIFLSIGYSTCYWCHVMEKDSFEIQEVADALNRDFISIKVDREEHPDVDQIYMDAVMALTGRGGWPMSVFLTPDLKPFFGGTYFPRPQFLQILEQIRQMWQANPQKILESASTLTQHLQASEQKGNASILQEEALREAFRQLRRSFDSSYGGFGEAPKFPHSMGLSLLLRLHRRSGDREALEMVTKSLDKMMNGGIYDHLGGGFHRYSTDTRWLVPHFEKMLYDNALLAWTYLEAYQVTNEKRYAQAARETLDYVLRDMTHPEGGFYSAEDAGEVGREGDFYLWKEEELKKILTPQEFDQVKKVFNVFPQGNFTHESPIAGGSSHHDNILHLGPGIHWEEKYTPLLQGAMTKLMAARSKRKRPHLDDKVLTAWNGLMIATLAKGSQVLQEPRYLTAAQKASSFLQKNLFKVEAQQAAPLLLRRFRDGEARFHGTVADYAATIFGLITLYESDFDPKWFTWATELQKIQDNLFLDPKNGGYFYTEAGEKNLLVRKKETYDGALPSANSLAALNLLKLYGLSYNEAYQKKASALFASVADQVGKYPTGYTQLLIALDYALDDPKEIAVIGEKGDPQTQAILRLLHETFLPNQSIAFGPDGSGVPPLLKGKIKQGGKTTVYVCQNKTCQAPTSDLEMVKRLATPFKKLNL